MEKEYYMVATNSRSERKMANLILKKASSMGFEKQICNTHYNCYYPVTLLFK